MYTPELLAPAGSLKNMQYAFAYGADAVYAGQPRYSMRVRNNEFTLENLRLGIEEAHRLGKKFYVACNIQPHNAKLKTLIKDLQPIVYMQPDALIMSDPGVIMLVREHFPQMALHLSVQANAVNWASVKFWGKQGIERVILSRELSLEEIAEIREHCPDMEIELFVHGALCMAYSGRCLLSGYINKRDPNQGTCTNACRWQYKAQPAQEDENGQIVEVQPAQAVPFDPAVAPTLGEGPTTNQAVLLTEQHRPDEQMAAFEDEHGTYIMNSKDLRAVQHVEQLAQIGVHSLKIEGRTKSFYYCARTAQVYRQAIDDAVAGKPFDSKLMQALEGLASRGYTEGFFRRHTHESYQNYEYGYSISDSQQFVGEFTGKREQGFAEVDVKNKFLVGDRLEIMTPKGNRDIALTQMRDRKGQAIEDAKGNGHMVWIAIPDDIDLEFALAVRYFQAGQTTRQPQASQSAS